MKCYEIISIIIGAVGIIVTSVLTITIHISGKKNNFIKYYDRIVFDKDFSIILEILSTEAGNKDEIWKAFTAVRANSVLLENFLAFLNLIFYEYRYSKIIIIALNEPIIKPVITDLTIYGLIAYKNNKYNCYRYLYKKLKAVQMKGVKYGKK